jgi:hypothetical protein
MADNLFSVEGIQSAKTDEVMRSTSEKEMAQFRKSAMKQQDNMVKKMALEKEKQDKIGEIKTARLLQMKVIRRFQAFPFLQEKVPHLSGKPSLAELQETDELQKLELDLQGSEKRMLSLVSQGGYLIEGIWGDGSKLPAWVPPKLRLNLDGFGKVVNSEQFLMEAAPLIEETVIEYPWMCQMGLPMRWAQCILNTMIVVHAMNTSPAFKKMMEKENIVPEENFDETKEMN